MGQLFFHVFTSGKVNYDSSMDEKGLIF